MPIILILALIAAGSGVTYQAQTALPGDFLYPVKVSVNEPARFMLAGSAEGHAQALVRQATERLAEAERLASQGLLDGPAIFSLREKFDSESREVSAAVHSLADSGDVDGAERVSSSFEALLRKHEAAFADIYKERNADAGPLVDLSASVAVRSAEIAKARSSLATVARNEIAPGQPTAGSQTSVTPVLAASDSSENNISASSSKVTLNGASASLMASTSAAASSIGSAILSLLSKVI